MLRAFAKVITRPNQVSIPQQALKISGNHLRTMSIFNTSRLEGKTVLITGASAGIGASTAVLFARAGSNLVLTARRADKLEETKKACEAAGKGKVVTISADMQKREDLDQILSKTEGLTIDM